MVPSADEGCMRVAKAAAFIAVALIGCDKLGVGSSGGGAGTAPSTTQATAAPPASSAAPAATAPAAAAGSLGVPACDQYIALYQCYLEKTHAPDADKVIAGLRTAYEQSDKSDAAKAAVAKSCAHAAHKIAKRARHAGCKGDAPAPPDEPRAAKAKGGAAAAAAAAPAAAASDGAFKPAPGDPKLTQAGTQHIGCHRGVCNTALAACCENVATHEAQCVPHTARTGTGDFCFGNDKQWVVAFDCAQYTGCGSKRCCKVPIASAPGMDKDVCLDTCGDDPEVCTAPGGACASGQTCTATEKERSGGICSGAAGQHVVASGPPTPTGQACQMAVECEDYDHTICEGGQCKRCAPPLVANEDTCVPACGPNGECPTGTGCMPIGHEDTLMGCVKQ